MKPIKLTIMGLNSFVEEQEIDFEKLSAGGLFGIFGPTGSGKSSIVDAMTMALYGELPRNEGDGKQCINTGCDVMNVRFEFEIRGASGNNRYVAERSYKKGKKDITQSARLYRNGTSGTEVIADKVKRVTEEVVNLIGLSYSDFSRSVVLPQGKFSEFLLLENKDRRDMLERIFRLERYGRYLSRRIKDDADDVNSQLRLTENSLGFFQGVTEEALEACRKQYTEECGLLGTLKSSFEEKNKLFLRLKGIQELNNEYTGNIARLKAAKDIEENVDHKRAALRDAKKADVVRPFILNVNDTAAKLKNNILDASKETLSLQEKLENEKMLNAQYTENLKIKDERYPLLLSMETSLEQAAKKITRLEEIKSERAALLDLYNEHNAAIKQLKEEMAAKEKEYKEDGDKLQAMVSRKIEVSLPPPLRSAISEGYETSRALDGISKKIEAASKKLDKMNKSITENNKALADVKVLTEGGNKEYDAVARLQNDMLKKDADDKQKALEAIETHIHELEDKLKSCTARLAEAAVHNSAAKLSALLNDGKPCPVCGSVSHPSPAVTHIGDEILLQEEYDRLLKEEKAASQKKQRIASELSVVLNELENGRITDEMKALTKKINDGEIRFASLSETLKKDTEAARELEDEKNELECEKSKLAETLAALSSIAELKNSSGDFIIWNDRIKAYDIEKAELEKEEDRTRRHMDAIRTSLDTKKQKSEFHEKELQGIIVSGREKKEVIDAAEREILELLRDGGEATTAADSRYIKKQLSDIKEEQTALIGNTEKLKQRLEAVANERQRIQERNAGLLKQQETLQEILKDQTRQLDEKLNENGFSSAEAASYATTSADSQKALEDEIKQYDDTVKSIHDNISRLSLRLKDEDTAGIDDRLRLLRAELGTITSETENKTRLTAVLKEKAEKMAADLIKSTELQLEKKHLLHRSDLLKELTSLFEGNKFVEFIARRQLKYISSEASRRLREMTGGRYALELDGTDFVIRDDHNGGIRRSPRTLSGGETFMASLCLALALSSRIQLKNSAPLEFFFLDEGFGTLDAGVLDVVISCLEGLRLENLSVGLISHVEELKSRIPAKLTVEPPQHGLHGSIVQIS